MKTRGNRVLGAFALAVLAALGGCEATVTDPDSETHWVACEADANCAELGPGFRCIEGRCVAGTTGDGGPVAPAERCGATPRTLVEPSLLLPGTSVEEVMMSMIDIVANETDIYYALDLSQNTVVDGGVVRVPIRGGAPELIAPIVGRKESLLLTPTSVVFSQTHIGPNDDVSTEIFGVALDGGTPTLLATAVSDMTVSLVADDRNLYFADGEGTKSMPLSGGTPRLVTTERGGLALVGTDLVIANGPRGTIVRVPASGGTPVTVAWEQPGASLPVGCGPDLCWTTGVHGSAIIGGDGAIVRRRAGGALETIVAGPDIFFARQLLFDGTSFFVGFFWDLPPHDGTPVRLGADGGESGSFPFGSGSIAVDDRCAYMAGQTTGITSVVKSYVSAPSE